MARYPKIQRSRTSRKIRFIGRRMVRPAPVARRSLSKAPVDPPDPLCCGHTDRHRVSRAVLRGRSRASGGNRASPTRGNIGKRWTVLEAAVTSIGSATVMRTAILTVLLTLVAACGPVERPVAVRPAVASLEGQGFDCEGPTRGNIPNSLLDWTCFGDAAGTSVGVTISGDHLGVFEAGIVIRSAATHGGQIASLIQIVELTKLGGTHQAELIDWLRVWPGGDRSITFGALDAQIHADAGPTLLVSPGPRELVDDRG